MLWDLAVLCQRLLILPIARQPQGLCGWVTQGGSQYIVHTRAHAGSTHLPAPSEHRCTNPLGSAWESGCS